MEELIRVGRPEFLIELGGGSEASHGPSLVRRAGRRYIARITSARLSR
jgi:hypothetical protein